MRLSGLSLAVVLVVSPAVFAQHSSGGGSSGGSSSAGGGSHSGSSSSGTSGSSHVSSGGGHSHSSGGLSRMVRLPTDRTRPLPHTPAQTTGRRAVCTRMSSARSANQLCETRLARSHLRRERSFHFCGTLSGGLPQNPLPT